MGRQALRAATVGICLFWTLACSIEIAKPAAALPRVQPGAVLTVEHAYRTVKDKKVSVLTSLEEAGEVLVARSSRGEPAGNPIAADFVGFEGELEMGAELVVSFQRGQKGNVVTELATEP